MKKTIGFIGLGSMGKPMAVNLLKAEYPLVVTYNRNKTPAEDLKNLGATVVDSIKSVAEQSDLVITVLPADKEIIDVYTSPNGLLNNLKPGSLCIDMTSAKGKTLEEVAVLAKEKNIDILDAPVSGGEAGAIQGTLTIMVGGEESILEKYRPVLEAMGKKIFYTGPVGSGKAVKMINQFINAGNTYIASEAIYLAKNLNLDMDLFSDIVSQSSGGSYVFQNAAMKAIIPENFEKGFKLDLMKKDIGLSVEQAGDMGIELPIMNNIYRIYQEVSEQNYGNKHYGVISEWVKQINNK